MSQPPKLMRKNLPARDNRTPAKDLVRARVEAKRTGGLRLPIGCIIIGIAVLYFGERSVASIFHPGLEPKNSLAAMEQVASATFKTLWTSVTDRTPQVGDSSRGSVAAPEASGRNAFRLPNIVTRKQKNAGSAPGADSAPGIPAQGNAKAGAIAPPPVLSSNTIAAPQRVTINATTTNATWTGGSGSSDNWNDTANWAGALQPQGNDGSTVIHFAGSTRTSPNNNYTAFTLESQIVFDAGAASFTLNGNAIKLNSKIENNSANTQTYNMSGLSFAPSVNGGFVELDPTAGDLIINTPGSSIFLDSNAVLEVFGGSHVLRINAVIANGTSSTGSFALMSSGPTVIFNNANTYSGDTQINAGDLQFTPAGSANSSIIRLGGTSDNSPAATLSLGAGDSATGVNVGSTLVVRPSNNGQGLRLLRNLNSVTTTYSGGIVLDANLTAQAATFGTLELSGTTNIKNHVLTIDDNNGNVNMQGGVVITGHLNSSFAAGGSLIKNGDNTLFIASTGNNYTGTDPTQLNPNGTQIGGGTLFILGDTSLGLVPNSAYNNIQFTGTAILLAASNITLNSKRNISVANGATAIFDTNGNTLTINGVINNPTGSGNILTQSSGSVVLGNPNTFTGTTTIKGGTLNASVAGALGGTSGITVKPGGTLLLSNGATNNRINDGASLTLDGNGTLAVSFDTGGLSEHGLSNNSAGIGALTLQTSSIIDLGNGASIIAFANSSTQAAAWGTGKVISIYNWSGTPITGGGTDQLYFGSDATGLAASQLLEFQFYSGAGSGAFTMGAIILANGEVVPVPEPGTWMVGLLALGAIGYWQRSSASQRHFRKEAKL